MAKEIFFIKGNIYKLYLSGQSSVGIQPVFSPWEGWDEVIDISGDDDHDDANDPDSGEECGCHRETEPGWRHETWTGQWTGFCGSRRAQAVRCHISGASSWSQSRLGFLCSDSNRHRYVSLFHASQHREGITGPQSPAKRTFVALHFILKYKSDSYL